MADGPHYQPGFLLQFKRWLFGREWAMEKVNRLRYSIHVFDTMCAQDKMPDKSKNELWDAITRMQGEIQWLKSTIEQPSKK